jgi:hypothetical protein
MAFNASAASKFLQAKAVLDEQSTPMDRQEEFIYKLSENEKRFEPGQPFILSDDAISRLCTFQPLFRALKAAFGQSLGEPILFADHIAIPIVAPTSVLGLTADGIKQTIYQCEHALKKNSRLENPLAHSQIHSHQSCIELLRQVQRLSNDDEPILAINDRTIVTPVPVLEPQHFVQPAKPQETRMEGAWPISGITMDHTRDRFTIQLTRSKFAVEAPRHRWSREELAAAVVAPMELSGTLSRSAPTEHWTPCEKTRIVPVLSLLEQETPD